MKYLYPLYGVLLCVFVLRTGHVSAQEAGYVPAELVIMLSPGTAVSDFRAEMNAAGEATDLALTALSPDIPVYLAQQPTLAGRETEVLNRIQGFRSVQAAQLNYRVHSRLLPNEPNFANQWNMNNTGQTGGTPDADVDAPEAWNTTTGGLTAAGDTIVVAVVDGGVQLSHPDLQANIWINYGEIPGNGIDDDGNGYTDDVNGWNAYNNNGSIPLDQHGTHVAGIIGARGNNGIGAVGINWNVKLMNIAGSSGNTATVISAYSYALQQRRLYNASNGEAGAFVVAVNSSFGVDFGLPSNYPVWCAFYDTMGAAGILNVGATANANTNVDVQGDIPTACPSNYLVTVTNSTNTDVKNNGAGYGLNSIDLAAPGTSIYSTVTGSSYGNLTGTSMATPMVAGIIGLMYAYPCATIGTLMHQDPAGFALLVKSALLDGVDALPAFAANTVSGGRANARKALDSVALLCSLPLPVGIRSFEVHAEGCAVIVSWQSEQEEALQAYRVEYSKDGRVFEEKSKVGIDAAAGGKYRVVLPGGKAGYYRLGMESRDRSLTYSPVAAVMLTGCLQQQIRIHPNPAAGEGWVLEGAREGQELCLYDMSGRLLIHDPVQSARQLVATAALVPGMYMLQVREGNIVIARHKLIRQ